MSDDLKPRSRITPSVYKVGVFAAVTVLLIGVLATLIGNISFAPTRTYSALFSDASGVFPGDQVRISGVEVGTVKSLRLVTSGSRHVALVRFGVQKTVPVLANARLQLRYASIVGQRYLAIDERPGSGPERSPGSTFPLDQTSPALNLTVLFNGFQPLFRALNPADTNQLSYQLVRAFQGDSGTIGSLMQHTASLTNALADKDVVIGQVIDNLNAVLGTVDQRDTQLTRLIVQFRSLMSGLSKDRDTISTSLPQLADLLSSTQGLIVDVRGPLRDNVRALNVLASGIADTRGELDSAIQGMPKRLRAIDRTASYGSLFNFALCGLQVTLQLPGGSSVLSGPAVKANDPASICGGSGE